ncbi:unnamed protein product [Phytophthora fragariaefolia]|uniref:Unnamed protein product n=1 Tax=Phytophthora fragariaefolia TaxID=1490495 RepID=A0A9W6YPC8_9STRA|nr:unnamed protein product [Phytophthora fragariaefolia]
MDSRTQGGARDQGAQDQDGNVSEAFFSDEGSEPQQQTSTPPNLSDWTTHAYVGGDGSSNWIDLRPRVALQSASLTDSMPAQTPSIPLLARTAIPSYGGFTLQDVPTGTDFGLGAPRMSSRPGAGFGGSAHPPSRAGETSHMGLSYSQPFTSENTPTGPDSVPSTAGSVSASGYQASLEDWLNLVTVWLRRLATEEKVLTSTPKMVKWCVDAVMCLDAAVSTAVDRSLLVPTAKEEITLASNVRLPVTNLVVEVVHKDKAAARTASGHAMCVASLTTLPLSALR